MYMVAFRGTFLRIDSINKIVTKILWADRQEVAPESVSNALRNYIF